MPKEEKVQVRFITTPAQRLALHRLAAERGENFGALMRDLVELATGVPNGMKRVKRHDRARSCDGKVRRFAGFRRKDGTYPREKYREAMERDLRVLRGVGQATAREFAEASGSDEQAARRALKRLAGAGLATTAAGPIPPDGGRIPYAYRPVEEIPGTPDTERRTAAGRGDPGPYEYTAVEEDTG